MAGAAAVVFRRDTRPLDCGPFFAGLDPDGRAAAVRTRTAGAELAEVPQGRWSQATGPSDHGDFLLVSAGEVIADPAPDWAAIVAGLRAGRYRLPDLSGRFAVFILDRRTPTAWLISDHLSQYPAWFRHDQTGFAFSTSPAAFLRLPRPPAFDPRWLFDLLAFNFSPTHRSFLAGVQRMPAGSVLTLSLDSLEWRLDRWAPPLAPSIPDTPPAEQAEAAVDLFRRRAPLFLAGNELPVAGLTSGFDSRTILALYMDHPRFQTFTYGGPGCQDIEEARRLADALRLPYRTVPFDAAFEAQLPELAVDCVWRSQGQQGCIRSTLLYAYWQLAAGLPETPVILSGVSGDQLFRGHGNVPSIVSSLMDSAFRGRLVDEDITAVAEGFLDTAACAGHIRATLDELAATHGPLHRAEAAMGYLTWVVPAEYFSGEAVLADDYGRFRTPFCDTEVVRLAWSTSLSSLTFSKFAGDQHDNRLKNYLPATLIASNPRLARTSIQDRPLSAFASGSPAWYLLASAWSKATRRLRGSRPAGTMPPLEDWHAWFRGPLAPLVHRLLDGEPRIAQWLRPEFVRATVERGEPRRVGRLLSAEILLRLIENGWRREPLLDDLPAPQTATVSSISKSTTSTSASR